MVDDDIVEMHKELPDIDLQQGKISRLISFLFKRNKKEKVEKKLSDDEIYFSGLDKNNDE